MAEETSPWYFDIDGETQRLRLDGSWLDVWRRPAQDVVDARLGRILRRPFWTFFTALDRVRLFGETPAAGGIWMVFTESHLTYRAADASSFVEYRVPWTGEPGVQEHEVQLFPLAVPLNAPSDDNTEFLVDLGRGVRSAAILLEEPSGIERLGLGAWTDRRLVQAPVPPAMGSVASVWQPDLIASVPRNSPTPYDLVVSASELNIVRAADGATVATLPVSLSGEPFRVRMTGPQLEQAALVLANPQCPIAITPHQEGVVTLQHVTEDGTGYDPDVTARFAPPGRAVPLTTVSVALQTAVA